MFPILFGLHRSGLFIRVQEFRGVVNSILRLTRLPLRIEISSMLVCRVICIDVARLFVISEIRDTLDRGSCTL